MGDDDDDDDGRNTFGTNVGTCSLTVAAASVVILAIVPAVLDVGDERASKNDFGEGLMISGRRMSGVTGVLDARASFVDGA